MSTIIYPSPIFGPVHSRRLGLSLGINLLPADGKVCSFDCIYCECGFNGDHRPRLPMPAREEVAAKLEAKLQQMKLNHAITPLENPSQIKLVRRDIARMKTELRQRELNK